VALKIKRIYDPTTKADGCRVLVDRLWPRGVTKEQAAIDEWLKDIAPSPELRDWFGHKPDRFEEFRVCYQAELADNAAVPRIEELETGDRTVTLLYAAKDLKHNHAVVLKEFLQNHMNSFGR
jgi:uncharacterized protein YeaO (DUF488 family)